MPSRNQETFEQEETIVGNVVGADEGQAIVSGKAVTLETWIEEGRQLAVIVKDDMWAVADWWARGARYGERTKEAAKLFPTISIKRLENLGSTARAIESERRRESLPIGVHAEVASLPPDQQDELLAKAEANKWSVTKVRKERKDMQGEAEPEPEAGEPGKWDATLRKLRKELASYLSEMTPGEADELARLLLAEAAKAQKKASK
jgi:hypothetical protein